MLEAESHSVRKVLAQARERLKTAGVETAALDGRVLLAQAMNCTQTWFYTNPDAVLSADDLARFDAMLARREMRVPVSHILGAREFWSRPFIVSPDVLTPRPDSETLIEAVLDHVSNRTSPLQILDLGTGSGCLLLTLLSEIPGALGTGVDVSPAALQIAARNAEQLCCDDRVRWVEGEWEIELSDVFDIVISNPPYIETGDLAGLEPEVVTFEPGLALDGGADGLDAYRRILACVGAKMSEDGTVFLEIGSGQEATVTEIAREAGLARQDVRHDLSGTGRVLIFASL